MKSQDNDVLSGFEPAEGGKSVSFWDSDGRIYKVLRDVAFEMGKKPSELTREIVIENLDKYAQFQNLDSTKKKWIKLQQEQIEEGYARDLAKAQKKRSTFLNFICSQIYDMRLQGASAEEIEAWVAENKTLFENRGRLERYKHVKNNVKEYYSAYNKWAQRNKSSNSPVAFEAPEIPEGDTNDE